MSWPPLKLGILPAETCTKSPASSGKADLFEETEQSIRAQPFDHRVRVFLLPTMTDRLANSAIIHPAPVTVFADS